MSMRSSTRRGQVRAWLLTSAAATVAAAAVSTSATAGSFGLREQSAVGQGMSFAGMAAGGQGISGMFWNPAVVNQVVHFEGEQHVTGIAPSSKIDVDDSTKDGLNGIGGIVGRSFATGDSGQIGQNAVLSSGYNAYRLSDRVTVGLAITAPFGLVTDPRQDWAGQLLGRSSRVFSVNVQPIAGFQVTDWLSIAGGVQIQYLDIRLKRAAPGNPLDPLGALQPGSPSATLTGDDIGIGFSGGFTIKPAEGTTIGVGYRSHIKHKLDGDIRLPFSDGQDDRIKANVTLPETVSVGIRQQITDQFLLAGGIEWTNWSRLDVVKVRGNTLAPDLPFNYDDGWFFSVGGEYSISPEFMVRAGVGYEVSPIDNKNRDVRVPDNDRWWLSAGGTYNYSENLSFDLGYSYVFVPGKSKIDVPLVTVPLPPAAGGPRTVDFKAKAESDVHILSLAVRYRFGGEAAPVLVTKY